MTAIIFIIILAILIFTHELGHFSAAKKFGIRVDEFGFGFPPKLLSFKKGETEYSINLIPIGGFVKIFGENSDEESESGPDNARSMIHKPRYIQAVVLAAGVFLNLVLAWGLFSASLFIGMPVALADLPAGAQIKEERLLITSVVKDSPADLSGLLAGDTILSLSNDAAKVVLPTTEEVQDFLQARENRPVEVAYSRGGGEELEEGILTVVPKAGVVGEKAGIGVSMERVGIARLSFFQSIITGLEFTYRMTIVTVVGFVDFVISLFTGGSQALAEVAGPIGLFGMVADISQLGLVYLINFTAVISINLAVLNLLPFPALDGGRLLFLAIEAVKGSRLNPKIANTLNVVGFSLLLLLMAVVAVSDILKII
ncbi:MAG TPA: site-2 protease family protein [Candidatus Paceibacterota bacterium]|nr:site-2 protease family protein [Candidatus Paceibacterota bacterium]